MSHWAGLGTGVKLIYKESVQESRVQDSENSFSVTPQEVGGGYESNEPKGGLVLATKVFLCVITARHNMSFQYSPDVESPKVGF